METEHCHQMAYCIVLMPCTVSTLNYINNNMEKWQAIV